MELYIHFPFCAQKCRYCDFASFSGLSSRMEEYTEALLQEAEMSREEITAPVQTVYFGGGTPSLVPTEIMKQLIQSLKQIISFSDVLEWTVEANPGTIREDWLDQMLAQGVNRLSIGVQAFQPRLLSLLGRIHDPEDTVNAVQAARKAGFRNISLDLIFGLPTQTMADWRETLEAAFSLQPEHLSAYGLIPEDGTPLKNDLDADRLTLPEPEEEREMYTLLRSMAAGHGFTQYEISSFSRKGYACQHNLGYWNQEAYLGLGVSAASMLHVSRKPSGALRGYDRRTNTDSFEEYLTRISSGVPAIKEETFIPPREAQFETIMLRLRTSEGVSDQFFRQFHGCSMKEVPGLRERLSLWQGRGLLREENCAWKLTAQGLDLQNMILADLLELFE